MMNEKWIELGELDAVVAARLRKEERREKEREGF